MKKFSFLIAIFFLSGCAKTFVKKPATFSLRFTPGQTADYTMKIERTITIKEGDSIRNYIMKYNLGLSETVSEVSSEFITLNLNITRASGAVTHNGKPFATEVFDRLKGHTITIRLTPGGDVVDIRGIEKLPTLQGSNAEFVADYEVFSLLYDYQNPGTFKPLDIYKKETKIGSKVYRYEGIDRSKSAKGSAYITFKGSFDVKDAGYIGTYAYKSFTKGSTSGYIYHLLDDGRPLEASEKFRLKDNYIFPGFSKLNKEIEVYTDVKVSQNINIGGVGHE